MQKRSLKKPRTHRFTSAFRWLTVLTRSFFIGRDNFDSNSQNKNLQSLKILSGGEIKDFYVVYVPCAQINSDDTEQLNFRFKFLILNSHIMSFYYPQDKAVKKTHSFV